MEIAKFKLDIQDNFIKLKGSIDSNRKTFMDEVFHYIKKSGDELVKDQKLFPQNANYSSFDNETKKLYEEIIKLVNSTVISQNQEISNVLSDTLPDFEQTSLSELETKIYNAKHNISFLNMDNINKLDSIIEKNMEKTLDQFFSDNKIEVDTKTKLDLRIDYCERINSNLSQVKREFINTSNNEIKKFYDDTLETFKEEKNITFEKDDNEKAVITDQNDQIISSIVDSEKKTKETVSAKNAMVTNEDIEIINKILSSFNKYNVKVYINDEGFIVAKDENSKDLEVKLNDDVLAVVYDENNKFGIKNSKDNNTVSVKMNDSFILYDNDTKEVKVSITNENISKRYSFEHQNNDTVIYEIIGDEKKEVSNINETIELLNNNGINLMEILNYSLDEYKMQMTNVVKETSNRN